MLGSGTLFDHPSLLHSRVWNEHGETSCSAKLLYDGLEVQPDQSLGDLYDGFEKYAVSGLPMPLPDKPIITQMSDTREAIQML